MRFFIIIPFLFTTIILFGQQKVKVHITYTNNYCLGTKPNDEILAKYRIPKNLSGFKIKLSGEKNVFITTDTAGYFIYKLKLGNYSLYLTEKVNRDIAVNYDPNCTKMIELSYAKLHIQKDTNRYEINLNFPCNLCEPSRP